MKMMMILILKRTTQKICFIGMKIHLKFSVFVVQDSEEIHAFVQSCHISSHEQDSILFQQWKKVYVRRGNIFQPMLHFVPVDSFGCSILVIEDNRSISETSTMKQLQDGITVVIPHEEWQKNCLAFLNMNDVIVTKICHCWRR